MALAAGRCNASLCQCSKMTLFFSLYRKHDHVQQLGLGFVWVWRHHQVLTLLDIICSFRSAAGASAETRGVICIFLIHSGKLARSFRGDGRTWAELRGQQGCAWVQEQDLSSPQLLNRIRWSRDRALGRGCWWHRP